MVAEQGGGYLITVKTPQKFSRLRRDFTLFTVFYYYLLTFFSLKTVVLALVLHFFAPAAHFFFPNYFYNSVCKKRFAHA